MHIIIIKCRVGGSKRFGGRHERKVKAIIIGEHNFSIAGGNWERIIGDRMCR